MTKDSCSIWYFMAIVVCVASVMAYGDSEQGYVIDNISVTGNRTITSSKVLAKVRSRAGEQFDSKMAAEDAERIAELAGVEYGYYNTVVSDDKIHLTFVIVERNLVRRISFVGNHKYKAKKLRKKTGFKIGDYLDQIEAEAARKKLVEFYQKKGFAFVQISLDKDKLSLGRLLYTIAEGPRVKLASVKFVGNETLKKRALANTVKTNTRKWFFWPKYYIEEHVDKQITKLQDVYYTRGFLNVGITAERQFNADKSKVHLTFVIKEGPAYTVERISISGNEHFDDNQLRDKLKSEEGKVYNKRKADSDVKQLLKLYRENGFIDAKVEQGTKFIAKDKISVAFQVTEGQRFRIGSVNITGNQDTQDKVIRRVLDESDFKPGQWYNADIVHGNGSGKLEKDIKRMLLTESATITPTGEVPGQKDAQVSVIEGQTGSVMLGAGVSSDSGALGQFVFEQRNFDITDKPESFGEFITGKAFKGAGQSLRIALEPGTELSRYSISFTEPYFQNRPTSLNVIGESYERERESYDEGRLRGYVGLEKRYKNRWRRSIAFRVEDVDVDSIESDAPKEIRDVKGGNLLVGVRLGVSRDLTDDKFVPSKGISFNASYEQVGGDHTFGILSGTYRYYKTLYEDLAERKTILATRLHAATIVGDAPPFEMFYAGGSRSIRGFDYRGVSTRGRQTNVTNPKKKDPIGSDWIMLASAEATVPLVGDSLSALFFVDSGIIDSGGYRVSVGTGVQILIPQWFGPVPMRFEIAAPFMKDGDDETQVFSFSVGRLF